MSSPFGLFGPQPPPTPLQEALARAGKDRDLCQPHGRLWDGGTDRPRVGPSLDATGGGPEQ